VDAQSVVESRGKSILKPFCPVCLFTMKQIPTQHARCISTAIDINEMKCKCNTTCKGGGVGGRDGGAGRGHCSNPCDFVGFFSILAFYPCTNARHPFVSPWTSVFCTGL
jgi:hypothetical protein